MSSENIRSSLEKLGYELSSHGNHWRCSAVYRNGKNPTALQIYKNTGIWKDFVHNTPYLPFTALVEATLKTNDPEVIKPFIIKDEFSASAPVLSEKIESEKIYSLDILDKLFPHYSFYENKGIDSGILTFLHSGLSTGGKLYQRFSFPIFNKNGSIHGFSGRDMLNSPSRPKWKHVGRTSNWVYPLYMPTDKEENSIRASILKSGSVILVESIGDLLNLHQHGFKNVLVIFGLSMGSKLLSSLVSLGVDKVFICLNNDSGKEINRGEEASVKIYLKLLSFFNKEKLFINLPIKKDFGDMNSEDFSKWSQRFKSLNFPKTREYIIKVAKKIEKDCPLPVYLKSNLRLLNE